MSRKPVMLDVGDSVLTECGGMFFAVGFLADDDGVPISARCCDVGHANEANVDACWSERMKRAI